MTLQVALEALTDEAAEWDETSQALVDCADIVTTLGRTQAQFSWLASTTGVDTSYEAVREYVMQVLWAGQAETTRLAEALRQIRRDYQSTDDSVHDRVAALWAPE